MIFSKEGEGFSAEARFHLFWAARADHLNDLILPALDAGTHVVSDRFDICTFAFQVFGEENSHLLHLFEKTRSSMRIDELKPVYIHFDLDPEIGLARKVDATDGNFFDKKGLDFHKRVREGYHFFARRYRGMRVIDASASLEKVWEAVQHELNIALA